MLLILCPFTADAMQFKVSQVGYHSHGPKIAYLEEVPADVNVKVVVFDPKWKDRFQLFEGRTVFKDPKVTDISDALGASPGLRTLQIDFSEFTTEGTYELRVENHPDVSAQAIEVNDYVYWDLLKPVVKTFYFQRSGQKLQDPRNQFYYYDCYTDDNLAIQNPLTVSTWDAGGGWYGDGGFNKKVTENSLAAARLMGLYESNPKAFQFFKLDYPFGETGVGSVPDVMLEMKIGLNWLMGMQRRDGSVFGGVSGSAIRCDDRDDFDEYQDRNVLDVNAKDTAAATAVLAMSGRVFKEKDLGYSVKSLLAAEKGWEYLEPISPAKADMPFRLWAAAELYITTQNPKYHDFFVKNYKQAALGLYSASNPMFQASLDYALYAKTRNDKIASDIRTHLVEAADVLMARVSERPLQGGLESFPDASNYLLVEHANLLLAAYQLTHEVSYRTAAADTLGYLFGLNPLGKTYVTGVGTDPVKSLSIQRFSVDTLPGFLIAGPNETADDGITPKDLGAMSFIDNPRATAVNHHSLLYNAGLAYALASLNASYNLSQETPQARKEQELKDKNASKIKKGLPFVK